MNNFFYRGGFGRGFRHGFGPGWRGGWGWWPRHHFWHHRHMGCCGPLFFLFLLAGLVPLAFAVIH